MPCRKQSTYEGVSGSGKSGGGGYATEAACLEACKEGACCEGTTCTVKPACQCQGAGKTFSGVGTTCASNPCLACNDCCGRECGGSLAQAKCDAFYVTVKTSCDSGSITLKEVWVNKVSGDTTFERSGTATFQSGHAIGTKALSLSCATGNCQNVPTSSFDLPFRVDDFNGWVAIQSCFTLAVTQLCGVSLSVTHIPIAVATCCGQPRGGGSEWIGYYNNCRQLGGSDCPTAASTTSNVKCITDLIGQSFSMPLTTLPEWSGQITVLQGGALDIVTLRKLFFSMTNMPTVRHEIVDIGLMPLP